MQFLFASVIVILYNISHLIRLYNRCFIMVVDCIMTNNFLNFLILLKIISIKKNIYILKYYSYSKISYKEKSIKNLKFDNHA